MQSILRRERSGDLNAVPPRLPKRNKSNTRWLFCHRHQMWAFFFLFIFLLQSLTVLITFLPLWAIVVLLPFSLQSPSLCRSIPDPYSSHSPLTLCFLGFFCWFFFYFFHNYSLSLLSEFLSFPGHLLTYVFSLGFLICQRP